MIDTKILSIDVKDIRFPSSIGHYGSDAMHDNPDYSCAYVLIYTNYKEYTGYGLTSTLGRGNEIVVQACKFISKLLIQKTMEEIFTDFGAFWKTIINDPAVKSMEIERGVARLAMAGVGNALWDLWARIEKKPVWKLLVDMTPEQLASNVNFQYITDFITEEEVIQMLRSGEAYKAECEETLKKNGFPAYMSNIGSTKYSLQKMKDICRYYVRLDFKMFKLPLYVDARQNAGRCTLMRRTIGWKNRELMLDANQVAVIDNVTSLLEGLRKYEPFWVEEVLHPDDIIGYSTLQNQLGGTIKLSGGEMYGSRLEIKQILQNKAFDFLQISLARLGGINDALAAYFMARKADVPICPHTGGLGLCEMAQHLQMWDFVCLSQTTENRVIEFIDYKHGYFVNPVYIVNGNYMPPTLPGYSTMFKEKAIQRWFYPTGSRWVYLLRLGFPGYFQRKEQQKEGQKRKFRRGSPKKKNKKGTQKKENTKRKMKKTF